MALTPAQVAEFRRDGFIIVPGIFSSEMMDRALEQVDLITYGRPYAEWAATATADTPSVADGISNTKANGRPQFPTGVPVLDKLIENPDYLDAMEQLLDTQDLHFCNAHLFVRAGPNDKRHFAHPWQGFHADHDTNTFLPPREPVGQYDTLATTILLHDIDPDGAPIMMIPGSHVDLAKNAVEYVRAGWMTSTNFLHDIRNFKSYDPNKFRSTVGKKGSVLFYSSYTVHAAIPFQNRTVQRSLWTLSMGRRSNQPWTGFVPPSYRYGEREHFVPFWQTTTPRVRSLFGWPKPGHPYYTRNTLELLHGTFPKVDLEPYYAALSDS
jgi:hypothetical protein